LDVGKAAAAPSGTFFVRVCQAIDWANDRSRISILRRHLSQIENPRLRNAFRAAVGPEAAGAPRSLQTSSPRIPLEGPATLSNPQSSDGCVASWSQFICRRCKRTCDSPRWFTPIGTIFYGARQPGAYRCEVRSCARGIDSPPAFGRPMPDDRGRAGMCTPSHAAPDAVRKTRDARGHIVNRFRGTFLQSG